MHDNAIAECGLQQLKTVSRGPSVEKLALYDEIGIGGIIRIKTDGTGREVFTRGVRNSVGHDFNSANGDLWWTDNQVDGLGDDIPPGELNRQTEAGQHFGFPWTNRP